eukprot:4426559-Pyramimonas_sp.AAC.1
MWRRRRRRTDDFQGLQGSRVEGLTSGIPCEGVEGQVEDASTGAAAPGGVDVQGHAPRPPHGGATVRTKSRSHLALG